MATKVEIRIYGGHGLKFNEPNGIYEASVTVQFETTVQSVGQPKNPASQPKNPNPKWNKALYIDVPNVVGASLTVQVLETSDTGNQTVLGKVDLPLNMLSSLESGKEVKHLHPLSTGGEVEIGLIPTHGVQSFGSSPTLAAPPASSADSEGFKRAQTVGPYALKKKSGPLREVLQYAPPDIQRIFPHLARGTYGIVFRGRVPGIPDYVVIKDMEIQNQKSIEEWQKEIDIMARTKSPYIAEVFGYSSQGTVLTIIMEFMKNGDLFGVLHKKPEKHPLSLVQRIRMARHSALGLEVLHKASIIHRDIKSMNILVDEQYNCKMTDFGCSKMVGSGQVFNTINTGTPLWMAPEVKMGTYGFPSDIYSLGLVLYEIFERKLPDYNPNTQHTTVPAQFQSLPVVLPCLNPVPQLRPTVHQVIEKLEHLIKSIISSVHKVLPPAEITEVKKLAMESIQQAQKDGHPLDPNEAEQAAVYQHLLSKPSTESDKFCVDAGISVGPAPVARTQSVQQQSGQPNVPYSDFMTPQVSQAPVAVAAPYVSPAHEGPRSSNPHILVKGASHVKSADRNGLSDPYAKIIMNGMMFKTPTHKKTLDPVWNYEIPTVGYHLVDLQIDVWDWDKIGGHDYLGFVVLNNVDVTKSQELWLDLAPRSKKDKNITGKLHLVVVP